MSDAGEIMLTVTVAASARPAPRNDQLDIIDQAGNQMTLTGDLTQGIKVPQGATLVDYRLDPPHIDIATGNPSISIGLAQNEGKAG